MVLSVDGTVAYATMEEMAATLRISVRKLHNLMKEGKAPRHVKIESRVLFVMPKEASND